MDKTHGAYTVEEIESAPDLSVHRMIVYFSAMSKVQQLRQEQAEAMAKAKSRVGR